MPAVKKERGRVLLVVLFGIYLGLLAWIALWKLEIPWIGTGALREINPIPFAPGPEGTLASPVEVVVNLLLFVPFGVYLGLLARSWSWWKVTGTVAGASLFLEVSQYILGVGRSDITDVVVNAAGGLIGYGLLILVHRRLKGKTQTFMTRVCLVGTVLAVLASGVFFVSPLHYAQREIAVSPAD